VRRRRGLVAHADRPGRGDDEQRRGQGHGPARHAPGEAPPDPGGSWTIPATTLKLPAGRHKLQTCWGTLGGSVIPFDTCLEKEVTLAAAGSATTLAKTAGFKRLPAPYTYYAAMYVKTYVNGVWTGGGGSWRGNHASRVTVPPPGASI
jgi:hypothetical protein